MYLTNESIEISFISAWLLAILSRRINDWVEGIISKYAHRWDILSISYQLDISESLWRWAGLIGMLVGNFLDYVSWVGKNPLPPPHSGHHHSLAGILGCVNGERELSTVCLLCSLLLVTDEWPVTSSPHFLDVAMEMDQEDNAPLTCKPELILSSSIDFVRVFWLQQEKELNR